MHLPGRLYHPPPPTRVREIKAQRGTVRVWLEAQALLSNIRSRSAAAVRAWETGGSGYAEQTLAILSTLIKLIG